MSKTTKLITFVAVLSMGLLGCGDSYERQIRLLETIASWNQVGHSADFWLEKHNAFGDWEKVGLIFGYWEDYEGCQDIAVTLTQKYPLAEYRCIPAN